MNVTAGAKILETVLANGHAVVLDRLANFRKASKLKWTKDRSLLERLAALYYSLSVFLGIYAYLLVFYLTWRFTWRFLVPFVPYLIYIFGPGLRAAHDGSWSTPLKRWGMWWELRKYFNARLHKTAELDPSKPYIFGYHPHGIMPVSGWLTFGTEATGFSKHFPGVEVRILTLALNFHGPILREYLLAHGVCDVSRSTCVNLLRKGKSIAIAVGGGSESLYCAPGTHEIILKRRKGFVKVALLTGASLVPVYSFGETDCFNTLNRMSFDSALRRFQRKMEKAWGWTWPVAWGTGVFLPIGLLPYPADINTVVGAPIEVPKYEGNLNSAEFAGLVDKYHNKYVDALVALFNEHREKYAKGEGNLTLVE